MATPEYHEEHHEKERKTGGFAAGGSIAEAIAGLAAVVLAILALAGMYPVMFVAIAAIAVGVGLLLQGGALMARYKYLLERTGHRTLNMATIGGGTSVEFIGGIGGIALGILSLLGIQPSILMPVAVIMFGAVLLVGAGVISGLSRARVATSGETATVQHVADEAINATASMEVLVGFAALVLGILALIGFAPLTLTLVGLLVTGTAIFFSGTSLGAHMSGVLAH